MYKVPLPVIERIQKHLKKVKKELKASEADTKISKENKALLKLLEDNYTPCKSL